MQLRQQPYLPDDDEWEIQNQSERIRKIVNLVVNFKNHTIFI